MAILWPELLLLAVSPSAFLLWFFYHKDRYKHERVLFLLKVFVLGAVSIVLAITVEALTEPVFRPDNSLLAATLFIFIIVGPIEEFSKFGAVRLRAYRSAEFDEPMDGIVLGVTAALGFATVENLFFVFGAPTPEEQILVGIFRAFLSVPGHAFWGAIMGFYLGQAKFLKKPWLAPVGLALASLLHASYDTSTSIAEFLAGDSFALAIFGLLIIGGMVWLVFFKIVRREIAEAEEESPHKTSGPA